MEELYKRFGIDIDRKKAELIFKNKIENLLIHGQLGDGSIKNYNRDDIEMIISITAAFLRFIIKKYELRK